MKSTSHCWPSYYVVAIHSMVDTTVLLHTWSTFEFLILFGKAFQHRNNIICSAPSMSQWSPPAFCSLPYQRFLLTFYGWNKRGERLCYLKIVHFIINVNTSSSNSWFCSGCYSLLRDRDCQFPAWWNSGDGHDHVTSCYKPKQSNNLKLHITCTGDLVKSDCWLIYFSKLKTSLFFSKGTN